MEETSMTDHTAILAFYGRMEHGRPVLDDAPGFQRLKESLDGQDIEIILRKRRKDRSSQANRFYHGVVVKLLSEHTGHTPSETHDILKYRFLIDREDERLPRVRSTASLDTAEFARYLEDCIQLAAEMGVVIPDPCAVA